MHIAVDYSLKVLLHMSPASRKITSWQNTQSSYFVHTSHQF